MWRQGPHQVISQQDAAVERRMREERVYEGEKRGEEYKLAANSMSKVLRDLMILIPLNDPVNGLF